MKRFLGPLSLACLLLFGISLETRANKAAPTAKKPINATLSVETDSKAYDARLQIPQATINELQKALAQLPSDESNQSNVQSVDHNSTRTVMAGLSMFLAISFGGIWMIRSSSSRSQKTLAAVLIAGVVFGATAIITQANAGPPPSYRWRQLPKNLSEGKKTQGDVVIEIVSDHEGIRLILPLTTPKTEE